MFSYADRERELKQLEESRFDVIVIGGGITGAGVLLDAQSRGLNCCLFEMQDFSEGTSSRSTRFIHGGLRYLKQWNFKVVKETGRERQVIFHVARHLTYPKEVVVPVFKGVGYKKWQLRLAMSVYQKLAGVPYEFHYKVLSNEALKEKIPTIDTDSTKGGVSYYEFQTNDARLTIENIKTAVSLGSKAFSRMKVERIIYENNLAVGVEVVDQIEQKRFQVFAKTIVNATGIWSEILDNKDNSFKVVPTKGVHIVFDNQRFPLETTVYFDTGDNRMIFAIPHANKVYVGTTDTFYQENLSSPKVDQKDINYLLQNVNLRFPNVKLTAKDVTSSWAGLRPLIHEKGKSPSEISRKHSIHFEKNLLTIAGGKLTGYRLMAEEVVNMLQSKVLNNTSKSKTHELSLIGSKGLDDSDYNSVKQEFINSQKESSTSVLNREWCFDLFGTEASKLSTITTSKTYDLPPYLLQSLLYSIHNEMCLSVHDFLVRRTDLFYFQQTVVKQYVETIQLVIEDEMNIDSAWSKRQLDKMLAEYASLKQQRLQE